MQPFVQCGDDAMAFRNQNRSAARDEAYIWWRYGERPCAVPAAVAWAHVGMTPAAAATIAPHEFCINDQLHVLGVVGDISVAESQRGRGVASRLLGWLGGQTLGEGRVSTYFVMPNDEVTGALCRAGWNEAAQVGRLVRLLDLSGRVRRRFGDNMLTRSVVWAGNLVLRSKADFAGAGLWADELREFDARFDELWAAVPKAGCALALRTRAYLDWRYCRNPRQRYRVLAISEQAEGALLGYVVFHLEDAMVAVDDFLVADASNARRVVAAFIAHVRAKVEGDAIQVRFNLDSSLAAPWRACGFVVRPDVQRVMTLSASNAALPATSRNWFVTPGDKDV